MMNLLVIMITFIRKLWNKFRKRNKFNRLKENLLTVDEARVYVYGSGSTTGTSYTITEQPSTGNFGATPHPWNTTSSPHFKFYLSSNGFTASPMNIKHCTTCKCFEKDAKDK